MVKFQLIYNNWMQLNMRFAWSIDHFCLLISAPQSSDLSPFPLTFRFDRLINNFLLRAWMKQQSGDSYRSLYLLLCECPVGKSRSSNLQYNLSLIYVFLHEETDFFYSTYFSEVLLFHRISLSNTWIVGLNAINSLIPVLTISCWIV